MQHPAKILATLTSSTLLALALAQAPAVLSLSDLNLGGSAYAKGGEGGNGGDKGGDRGGNGGDRGGNAGGHDGGRGNANGHDKEHGNQAGHDTKGGRALGHAEGRRHGHSLGNDHAAVASKLGRLNAAHANARALEKAAPGSAVGLLATYKETVLEGRALSDELAALESELASLDAELAQLAGAAPADALEEKQALEGRISELEAELASQAEREVEALAAAANKSVDDEVVEAVNELLGLTDSEPSPQ